MNISGNIPQSVTYFPRTVRKVGFQWEDDADNTVSQEVPVRPAYCSDTANKKTLETGARWQSSEYDRWNPSTQQYDKVNKSTDTVVRNNDPIKGIRIVSLEIRDKGGRAYKVVTPDGFYFDLREDVLLDAMLRSKIEKGVLDGEFIWAKVGAQMKLIRVGSDLHEKLKEADARFRGAAVGKGNLVPGQTYLTKGGKTRLYLGTFATIEMTTATRKKNSGYYSSDEEYVTGNRPVKSIQCWLDIREYRVKELQNFKTFEDFLADYEYDHGGSKGELLNYSLIWSKDSKVASLGPHKFNLPADYLQQMQNLVLKWRPAKRNGWGSYEKISEAKLMHAVPLGQTPVLRPEFK